MDLDKALVAAILAGGRPALIQAMRAGLQIDFMLGEGRTAFEFVWGYFKDYGQIPNHAILLAKFGIMLEPNPGPVEFFVKEVLKRRVATRLQNTLSGASEFLQRRDVDAAYAEVREQLRIIEQEAITGPRVGNLLAKGQEAIDYYNLIKSGARGVQTPWPTINNATLGFWPEDFILFAARPGIGKTWLALMLLLKAWEDFEKTGDRALFVTTEMSQLRIAMRFYSLRFRLSYKDIRQGNLGTENEQTFFEGVKTLLTDDRLKIIGGDFDFKLESFEAAIEEAQPKIVYLDGAYLLRASGTSKNEQATNVFDELKRVAKRKQIPVVVTTQFNRKVDANDAGSVKSVDKLAQSDSAGWNADICYAIIQTDEMKRAKELILRPLKFREGEAEDLKIHWDIANMNFSEMQDGPVPGQGPAPDDGGTVVPF